jgi:hypothetical protein
MAEIRNYTMKLSVRRSLCSLNLLRKLANAEVHGVTLRPPAVDLRETGLHG